MNDAKYRTLFETLKKGILDGRYVAGTPFPSLRALIRRHGLSKTTVQRALDELVHQGFVSRRQGSGTFVSERGASRLVGLVVPGISYSSEFFQPIVAALLCAAHAADYTILMEGVWSADSAENGREAVEVAARLIKRKVAGVIYQPLEYSEQSSAINARVLAAFSRAGIPVVLLDGDIVSAPARSRYDLVSIDNVGAGEQVAEHLIACGAKTICFLQRANWVHNVRNRAQGVRNAVLAHGLNWRSSNVILADPLDREQIRRVLARRPRPDAFVCENDVLAARLLKTLTALGCRVPQDMLLAGFDDIQIARLSSPSLTTIRQPCETLARTAFARLLSRIDLPKQDPLHLMPTTELVVRESTAQMADAVPSAKPTKKQQKEKGGWKR